MKKRSQVRKLEREIAELRNEIQSLRMCIDRLEKIDVERTKYHNIVRQYKRSKTTETIDWKSAIRRLQEQ